MKCNQLILLLLLTTTTFIGHLSPLFLYNTFPINETLSPDVDLTLNFGDLFSNKDSKESQALDRSLPELNQESLIYDDSLVEFLSDLYLPQSCTPKGVNVIVSFKESIKYSERIDILNGILGEYKLLNNYHIIPATAIMCNPERLIDSHDKFSQVASIQKVYKSQTYSLPVITDGNLKISSQDEDDFPNWWVPALGAENVPGGYDGSGVRVAILDTGIYSHPDLNIVQEKSFVSSGANMEDGYGHGTHAAGIAASTGVYKGIAPGVSLIDARIGDDNGLLNDTDIIEAIEWSVSTADADILSMSFGTSVPLAHDVITAALRNATDLGVICVAAAGNSGPDYYTGGSPAAGLDVIAVGATDSNDHIASFSSRGPTYSHMAYPDVLAPGVAIISTDAKNSWLSLEKRYLGDIFDFEGDADYIPLDGTSMACPAVAGALAILLEAYPNLTPEAARIALARGARKPIYSNHDYQMYAGAGIVNVTASLAYLAGLDEGRENDTAMIFPNEIPFAPFDLLNFPGDYQEFNISVISSAELAYTLELPQSFNNISIISNTGLLDFSGDAGVDTFTLAIKIGLHTLPGTYEFTLNLTNGGKVYDNATLRLEIRQPEYKILMDSFHGMNDVFSELSQAFSYGQIGFYEAMRFMAESNISIDYGMEFWTPGYESNENNSILTLERLSQYDVVILQNPLIPYNPLEIHALKTYFEEGGSILFLGSRAKEMCVENINDLFAQLGSGIELTGNSLGTDKFIAVNPYAFGRYYVSQDITDFQAHPVFQGVSKFIWNYGAELSTSGNAEIIAELNDAGAVAAYNGTSNGKGNIVAFGDLSWMYSAFRSGVYHNNHRQLLNNVLDYLLPAENISISISLKSERTVSPDIPLSINIKNQTSNTPITTYVSLEVSLQNETDTNIMSINLNESNAPYGVYFNDSISIPYPMPAPYTINVTLTIGSGTYSTITRILYADPSQVPYIDSLTNNATKYGEIRGNTVRYNTSFSISGINVNGYMGIYPYSNLRMMQNINKSFTFSEAGMNKNTDYTLLDSDPGGYAVLYVVPTSTAGYIDPRSPRNRFYINGTHPSFDQLNSKVAGNALVLYDFGYLDVSQGTNINFAIHADDTEHSGSNLTIMAELMMAVTRIDGIYIYSSRVIPLNPEAEVLTYNSLTDTYEGTLTIPKRFSYDTLNGVKEISTLTGAYGEGDSLGFITIVLFDPDVGYDSTSIIITINDGGGEVEDPILDNNLIELILIMALIGIVVVAVIITIATHKRKKRNEYYNNF